MGDTDSPDKIFKVNAIGRTTGYIKFYDDQKGFGFLTKDPEQFLDFEVQASDKRNCDVFFHVLEFKKKVNLSLTPGKMVEFRLVRTSKGFQGHDCVLVDYLLPGDNVHNEHD